MCRELTLLGANDAEHADVAALNSAIDSLARERLDLAHARELGLFGISIPASYGGAGLGLHATCSVIQRLAQLDSASATTVGVHVGLGTRPLVAFGSDRLRAMWLPALARGDRIAAFAATEPGAGSDIAAIGTRATLDPERRVLRLDGQKAFITNGGIAGVITVLARTPGLGGGRRAQSLLLVERGDRGFTSGAEERKLGLQGSSTTPLFFDGVELDVGRIVGRPGDGESQLAAALAWGRVVMAAGCAGVADAAFQRAVAHVKRRVQFGRTLASLDVVREQIADMAARRFMTVSLVRWAALAADDPAPFTRRSLAAKVLASEAAWSVVDTALQLHGGSGYIENSGMPRLLRDARVMRIFEGANDVLLLRAGALATFGQRPDRRPIDERTDDLHAAVEARAATLVRDAGPRLAHRGRDLHRLGRAVLTCEAADAVALRAAADTAPSATLLARRWLGGAESALRELAGPTSMRHELIELTDAIYEGAPS
jgi:acyl-CoA dehydrogenase